MQQEKSLHEIRKENLENQLFDLYKLLKEYEEKLILESDPKRKMSYEKEIADLRIKITEKETELNGQQTFQSKLITTLPQVPDLCIGRSEKLNEINEKLKQRQPIALLNGVGGIGKTTLALEFVHTEAYIKAFDHVAWISLVTYSLHDALILGLHKYFRIVLEQFPDPKDQLNQLKHKMANLAGNNLLVIDNANNANELTENEGFLKSLGFKLLITSRAVPDNFVQIDVNELEMNDAKALFTYHYPESKTMEGLPELLQHINRHTLLTELLAKAGKKKYLTPLQILELLRQADTTHKDLNREITVGLHADMTDKQKETKLNTYIEALFEPENESAENQAFLKPFALFDNTDVALAHLKRMWNIAPDNENDFEDFLERLVIGGWLNKKATNYRIHPLVALVIRQKLKPTPDSTEELIETLENILDNEHLSTQSLYVPYAQNVVDRFKAEKNSWLGHLCLALSRTYSTLGQLTPALQTIETGEKNFEGIDKDNQSVCIQDIADIQMSLGKTMAALENYEKYKELRKELYNENPKNERFKNGLAISYSKLGEVYSELGKLDLALENYQKDIELSKELYKHNPQNESLKNGLAISYEKLGNVYSALGKLDLALENYQERNRLSEELYKHNPQNERLKNGLAISYSKLGNVYSALGNLDLALENYLEMTKLFKELYKHNPQNESLKNGLAISYSKLGEVYEALGKLDLALENYQEYHKLKEELYKHNPQNVNLFYGLGVSYWNLGDIYSRLENTKKSKENYTFALPIFEKLYEIYNLDKYKNWAEALKEKIK